MAKLQSKKKMSLNTKELILIAHNIRSLHNVGAIFRTADCFGVSKIYLSGYTGAPPDSKIAKVALGAEEFVTWEKKARLKPLIAKLRKDNPGIEILVLENNVDYPTVQLGKYHIKGPVALILGEETKGNTKAILDLADKVLEIPLYGRKESLNVSVACGVALFGLISDNR